MEKAIEQLKQDPSLELLNLTDPDAPLMKGKRGRKLAMKEVLEEEKQDKPKRVRANNEQDVIYDPEAAAARRKSLRGSSLRGSTPANQDDAGNN